jgi:hypothetical protein
MNVFLVFAQVPGLPIPPLPPIFLWLTITVGGLVFGILYFPRKNGHVKLGFV